MKKKPVSVFVWTAAALALVIAGVSSCGRKNSPAADTNPAPEPAPTNAAKLADTNAAIAASQAATNVTTSTNSAPAAITNQPAAETATPAPATEDPAPTKPIIADQTKVVEMPTNAPVAPTNFYSSDFAKMNCCAADAKETGDSSGNYYFRLQGGYQHVNHGDNNDTYWLSVKFFARGDALRERAGKSAWLVPDADLEVSHQYVAKPDSIAPSGSSDGMQLRASLYWPWLHWSTRLQGNTNSFCPYVRPLNFAFGPTANVGFDMLFDDRDVRLARYFGARLTINREGFIEYTVGDTDGLAGTRHQVRAELPFYISRDGEVRYVFLGLWNTGSKHSPDLWQAGVAVEMPLGFLVQPAKWGSLVPFKK